MYDIRCHHLRSRGGRTQPDRRLGSFWRLTFPEPVCGPLALGFGWHFGLRLGGRVLTLYICDRFAVRFARHAQLFA